MPKGMRRDGEFGNKALRKFGMIQDNVNDAEHRTFELLLSHQQSYHFCK